LAFVVDDLRGAGLECGRAEAPVAWLDGDLAEPALSA
jgi:hypothetical protein